jgi:hypothetical protein
MATEEVSRGPLVDARSLAPPLAGQWYHLVGVYDRAANDLRLYVNGKLEGARAGPTTPWSAGGPLIVGSAGWIADGRRSNPMVGTVSDVKTWRGALTADQAMEVYGGNSAVRQLSGWNLDGTEADDVGTHSLAVVGAEGVDYG